MTDVTGTGGVGFMIGSPGVGGISIVGGGGPSTSLPAGTNSVTIAIEVTYSIFALDVTLDVGPNGISFDNAAIGVGWVASGNSAGFVGLGYNASTNSFGIQIAASGQQPGQVFGAWNLSGSFDLVSAPTVANFMNSNLPAMMQSQSPFPLNMPESDRQAEAPPLDTFPEYGTQPVDYPNGPMSDLMRFRVRTQLSLSNGPGVGLHAFPVTAPSCHYPNGFQEAYNPNNPQPQRNYLFPEYAPTCRYLMGLFGLNPDSFPDRINLPVFPTATPVSVFYQVLKPSPLSWVDPVTLGSSNGNYGFGGEPPSTAPQPAPSSRPG